MALSQVFVYNIFTLSSKPVGNQVITENLSLYEINTNIYFSLKITVEKIHINLGFFKLFNIILNNIPEKCVYI